MVVSEDKIAPKLLRRNDMEYTLMFYMSPSEFSARTDPDKRATFWGAFLPYMQAVKGAGIFKGRAGLEPPGRRSFCFTGRPESDST